MKKRILWVTVIATIVCLAWSAAVIGECDHGRFCSGETCVYCGEAYIGDSIHFHSDCVWFGDEEGCYSQCRACGYTSEKESHRRLCIDQTCLMCGEAYNGDRVDHTNYQIQISANEHWGSCFECGYEEENKQPHMRLCTESVCFVCNTPYTGDEVSHSYGKLVGDEGWHWNACMKCDVMLNKNEHCRDCTETVCNACEMPYTGDNVIHEEWIFKGDVSNHWLECSVCGLKNEKTSHWRYCKNDYCEVCGLAYVGDQSFHTGELNWVGDEVSHWQICIECNNSIGDAAAHWKYCTENACEVCGIAFENGYTEHKNPVMDYDDTFHWYSCDDCGMIELGMHYRNCQEEVCLSCNYPYTGDNTSHEGKWHKDDTYHWYECALCGEITAQSEHWRMCNEDVCCECGEPYVGDNLSHDNASWSGDEMYHWFICQNCGYSSEKEEHSRWCNEDVCMDCGAAYNGGNTWHEFEGYSDDTGHWWICKVCGAEDGKYDHWRWCIEEVCAECNAAYTGDRVEHYEVDWDGDENFHWNSCIACKQASVKSSHWRWCHEDVCAECRKPYTGDETYHYDNTWHKTETHHWYDCTMCGFTSPKGTHWRLCGDEVCAECEAVYTGNSVEHYNVKWMNDETKHWYECQSCGYASEKSEHWRWCNQSTCGGCGLFYTGDEAIHVEPDWTSDAAGHSFECMACGFDSEVEEHERFCTEKKCFDCGHVYEGKNYFHLNCEIKDTEEGEHISICYDCGYSECYRFCDSEFCWACGQEYAGDEVKHFEGEWVVIEEATSEKEGLKEMRCNFCGFLMKTEQIPKTEEEKVVHGDVSGDGKIDGRDLLRLAKFIGGYAVDIDEKSASVNGDSLVDGRDLLRLAKYLGGFDVELK